jgi:simple sugar transport system permease protein/D-ribose pyranase
MKRKGVLNKELAEAIASMGHGDMLVVCDAGFPIPENTWRIDLALVKDIPDLETVLSIVAEEFIAEKVTFSEELRENNPLLYDKLKSIFDERDFESISYTQMVSEIPKTAKAIVRTGAFDPWGNIALTSGIDVANWFSKEGLIMPESYRQRMERA